MAKNLFKIAKQKKIKYKKNKSTAKGNAKENLTYVDAIVDTSLFIFFWNEDLKF